MGIGGIGMSAIAEVMHTRGYRVQGSDLKEGANLQRLRDHGIACLIGALIMLATHAPGTSTNVAKRPKKRFQKRIFTG